MNHFSYSGGEYRAEEVALSRIAEAVGTPFYCYSSATMVRHYRMLAEALEGVPARIFYALKANSNLAVIRTLAAQGAGADVVSEGEIRRALAAGVTPDSIVFSGVGKTAEEMAFAIEAGILQFNIESEPELDLLAEVAGARNTTVEIAVRINPDVDAHSHDKISTGRRGDKFGIAWPGARETYARAAAMPAINVAGVAVHIGSQILDLAPFEAAFGIAAQAVETLRGDGHAIRRLDLGGGLGVPYGGELPPPPSAYGDLVRRTCAGLGCDIMLEPGRLLVANAGVLVTRVLFVKESAERTFYIVDAAMNDLLRPNLYEARHGIVPLAEAPPGVPSRPVDVVGPVCESGDILAENCDLPAAVAGDLLAIRTAGAYGAVMASTYNSRLLVPEVLVNGAEFAVVRDRPSHDDLLAGEHLPGWLGPAAAPGTAKGIA